MSAEKRSNVLPNTPPGPNLCSFAQKFKPSVVNEAAGIHLYCEFARCYLCLFIHGRGSGGLYFIYKIYFFMLWTLALALVCGTVFVGCFLFRFLCMYILTLFTEVGGFIPGFGLVHPVTESTSDKFGHQKVGAVC